MKTPIKHTAYGYIYHPALEGVTTTSFAHLHLGPALLSGTTLREHLLIEDQLRLRMERLRF